MKRIVAILLLFLICAACVKTPEETVVMRKDQEAMVEKAKDALPQEEQTKPLKDRLGVPGRYQYEYQNGYVTIEADAETVVPDGEIPIIRVFPDNFDQSTASQLWDTLIGDMPMYEYDSAATKEAIELQMKYLIRIIDGEIPQEEAMENVEEAQAELAALQQQYANAPDTVPCVAAEATLKTAYIGTGRNPRMAKYTYLSGTSLETGCYFQLVNNLDNTEPIVLRENEGESIRPVLRNAYMNYGGKSAPESACYRIVGRFDGTDALPDEIERSFPVTPQEALMQAQVFLESAGLRDCFAPCDILLIDGTVNDERIYAYRVVCARSVRGIPCLSAVGVPDAWSAYDAYKPIWTYEQLMIGIGRNGIYSVSWSSPHAQSDVIAEQTKLLPFEEVRAIAEKMFPIVFAAQADGEATDRTQYTYRIERVQLGLWRIHEFNDIEKGLLIPVWGFYALAEETDRFGERTVRYAPILLINAVDGSIIDPVEGY